MNNAPYENLCKFFEIESRKKFNASMYNSHAIYAVFSIAQHFGLGFLQFMGNFGADSGLVLFCALFHPKYIIGESNFF